MAITAVLLYSGPTQQDKWLSTLVPPKKLVPPNRKKLSTLVPSKTQKMSFLQLEKTLVIFCVLCGTSVLSHIFCWGGPLPYFSEWNHLKKHPVPEVELFVFLIEIIRNYSS